MDIPQEAITAAAKAIDDFPRKAPAVKWEDYHPELARAILAAALPHLAEDAARDSAIGALIAAGEDLVGDWLGLAEGDRWHAAVQTARDVMRECQASAQVPPYAPGTTK